MKKLWWNIRYKFWSIFFSIKGKFPSKDSITITIDKEKAKQLNKELQYFDSLVKLDGEEVIVYENITDRN